MQIYSFNIIQTNRKYKCWLPFSNTNVLNVLYLVKTYILYKTLITCDVVQQV